MLPELQKCDFAVSRQIFKTYTQKPINRIQNWYGGLNVGTNRNTSNTGGFTIHKVQLVIAMCKTILQTNAEGSTFKCSQESQHLIYDFFSSWILKNIIKYDFAIFHQISKSSPDRIEYVNSNCECEM